MANLGPQIVQNSFGGLLKFETSGNTGVTTSQLRITDGSGKETPLFLATSSIKIESEFTASSDVVFSGLNTDAQGHYVSINSATGRLHYSATSSIVPTNAISASWAPDDGDWTIGSSYMTASGQTSVYIPNRLENGLGNKAVGIESHAEGANTVAIGNYSHAEGRNTSASGLWSHAEGSETVAEGNYSHAEGSQTTATEPGAHAEGYLTSASFNFAHAEGQQTKATAYASHAEGGNTLAEGDWSHAEGRNTSASGEWSHAEGSETLASGDWSHAEGKYTIASQGGAHAEGYQTVASGYYSHAEGFFTSASGPESHAEGNSTNADGFASHAEGDKTLASGTGSHSEGQFTTASGDYSHAEGEKTWAVGDFAHAGGLGTKASQPHQTVVGRYNDASQRLSPATFVVGTGISDSDRASGLKVQHSTHEVIVKQHIGASNNTNGPGLYFGEPSNPATSPNSVRIVSTEDGYMYFENYDAGSLEYVPSLFFTFNATFVPS